MPEMEPSVPAPSAMPAFLEVPASVLDDPDLALGCECADPALQIALWGEEARAPAAGAS